MAKNTIEEVTKLRKIEDTINPIKSETSSFVSIDPSAVTITDGVKKIFKEKAEKFRRPEPSEEDIKLKISRLVSDRLKYYFQNIPDHPSMGFPNDWKIEQVKVDYADRKYIFAIILLNTNENNRWFIFFDAKEDASKNIDPHYFNIQTKHFDINKFPMQEIARSPMEAKGKAVELTAKQFEDTIRSQRVGRISSKL